MANHQEFEVGWQWDDDMPLAQVVRVGDLLFLSGQVAVDSRGGIIGENDLEAQSRQIFENMKAVLAAAGAELTDIVRLTTYFSIDLTEEVTRTYWKVRKEYFGDHRPASTGMQVKALIYPALMLEVDAIAALSSERDVR
jgi:2-iminobutanoate/2-iminopropanoate deaminase